MQKIFVKLIFYHAKSAKAKEKVTKDEKNMT
jgi:hypothetical protein